MRGIEERENRATIHFGAGAKSPNLSTARSARSPSPWQRGSEEAGAGSKETAQGANGDMGFHVLRKGGGDQNSWGVDDRQQMSAAAAADGSLSGDPGRPPAPISGQAAA
ncbi:unnamed protein product [Boreogadus saida]